MSAFFKILVYWKKGTARTSATFFFNRFHRGQKVFCASEKSVERGHGLFPSNDGYVCLFRRARRCRTADCPKKNENSLARVVRLQGRLQGRPLCVFFFRKMPFGGRRVGGPHNVHCRSRPRWAAKMRQTGRSCARKKKRTGKVSFTAVFVRGTCFTVISNRKTEPAEKTT